MANTPKKAKDPTEAAMSAIQEALNVRDAEMKVTPARPAAMRPAAAQPNLAPPVAAPAPERRAQRTPPLPSDDDLFDPTRGDAEPGRPANDDLKSVGQILQTLQPRSSRTAYVVASIASAVWVAAIAAIASASMPDPRENFLALLALAFGAVVPVVFFYLLALTVNRSREMRLIAQSMAEVAMRLAEPETVARESIVTVGQAIRREVAAMGDGVERALARAAELEALVHNEVSALERAYNDNEVRIRGLLEDLAHQRNNLVGQAEQVRNAITSVHLDLNQDITGISDMVAQQVNVAAQQITQTLAEKGEHITLALGRAGDTMIDALGERGGDLLERLERANMETTHAIAAATQQLTNNLDSKTDQAVQAISLASQQLTQSLDFKTDNIPQEFEMLADNLSQMMQLRLANVTNDFDQRSNALVELMTDRSQQITTGLIDMSSQVAEAIATRGDEVNSTIKATGDSLVLDLSLRGGDVVSQIEQTGAKISDTISSRLASFEEMFTHGAAELTEKVSHDSSTLGNLIIRHLGEFDRTVKTFGGELVERLGERTQTVTDAMKNYVENFGEKVGAKASEVNETLDQRLLRFQEALDSRTQTLNDNMTQRVMDIAKTLAEGGKEVVSAFDKRITDQTASIDERSQQLATSIEELLAGRSEQAAKQIEERARAAADAITATTDHLRNSTQDLERTLNNVSGGVTSALKQNAGEVERTLLGVGAEVARGFVGKADEIAAAIAARAAEMTKVLDADSSTLLSALGGKSAEFTAEVNRATQEAVKAIEAKGFDFTRTMLDNSGELARLINEAGESATRKVNETLTGLQDTAKTAITQSQESAAGAVKEMLEAHNTLRTDTTGLFERLREANILLQEVLTGAHENMGALENTLTNRVQEFASVLNDVTERNNAATERVSVHVDAFRGETSRVLGDLSELATQFETHGRVLVEAVDLIEKSNRRTEDSVNERRTTLDQLTATLDLSSQDLEQRLTRFASLLDESLENATARAREIGRMIAETSSTGANSITEQFDQVRRNTEEERERTTTALQNIYDRATGDSQAMFRQTAEQFADTLQGMKQMAADMQRELEATRTEMRRGILELPQETAENAAQMRRVIVDQIEALAELNSIVARHGKTIESETRRAPAEPMLAVVGGRNEAPPARPARPDAPPRQPTPPMTPPMMAPTPPPGGMRESPSLSPGQGQNRGGPGGGWLTDLLHRADDGAEPAPPDGPPPRGRASAAPRDDRRPRQIDSLDALSVDIARMVDHEAAAQMWDRYNRGERNVFTRQLYTPHGQRAFDDIRHRYRGNREFRQTVDRYIGEFERLIDEVSRDERGGQQMVRTYLTSETGKVYTMLAHAAGRFE